MFVVARRLVVIGGLLLGTIGLAEGGLVTTTAGIASGELTLRRPDVVALPADPSGLEAVGELGTAVVVDARGSGAGWRLRIAATGVESGELSVTGVRVEALAGRPPANRVAYPVRVAFGAAEPVELFSAAPGSGMGTFALTPRAVARAPVDGGARHATVTLDLAAGP
jgi:hypothetical protein